MILRPKKYSERFISRIERSPNEIRPGRLIAQPAAQCLWLLLGFLIPQLPAFVSADPPVLQVLRATPDPYGYPRPFPNSQHVPVRTSFFIQLGFDKPTDDRLLEESLEVTLVDPEGERIVLVGPGLQFASGYRGSLQQTRAAAPTWALNLDGNAIGHGNRDSGAILRPETRYRIMVAALSRSGASLQAAGGSWYFTTQKQEIAEHAVDFRLDLSAANVQWHGGFFRGFCKPSFATSGSNMLPTYELMAEVRNDSPQAWIWQRDFWLTGMEHQPHFISPRLPNLVREQETRRIVRIEEAGSSRLLHLEDFVGHQQYGIAANRPLKGDYAAGEEVLVADGVNHITATVQEIFRDDGQTRILRVSGFEDPAGGWKLDYSAPLPEEELAFAPGLFAVGGCYLRKFRPAGTPRYYWGRVDREWDLVHGRLGHRLMVNFADAPGDLSVDGQNWTYPKDYAQYHQVVHTITTRLIQRYGDACLDFLWSVLNEPDLARAFWRSGDWNELQKFYDYTVDAVLRAFEDQGYDSSLVQVGGLEIGAIFGVNIERPVLGRFLAHCSPQAQRDGALAYNAVIEDSRLEGKRSRRVTELCRRTGRGSPCDFISVHAYNRSSTMAAKLIRAKELALEIDPDYYAELAVHSLESCPGWSPPPDMAAADSYLGNGYFPTWCADVACRLLRKAAEDQRYNRGDSVLTFWPWPNRNFGGHNAATRVIAVDQTGDGQADREETIAMPILHFLGLLARMESPFLVLDEQLVTGHVVSGFASRSGQTTRLLVYTHAAADTESRSDDRFQVRVLLTGLEGSRVRVRQYRFDRRHNSYFEEALALRDRRERGRTDPLPAAQVARLAADLQADNKQRQMAALAKIAGLSEVPQSLLAAGFTLQQTTEDIEVRAEIERIANRLGNRGDVYGPEEIASIIQRSRLAVTREQEYRVGPDGALTLRLELLTNGATYCELDRWDSR